jgi:hypothetical protein
MMSDTCLAVLMYGCPMSFSKGLSSSPLNKVAGSIISNSNWEMTDALHSTGLQSLKTELRKLMDFPVDRIFLVQVMARWNDLAVKNRITGW